MVLLTKVGVLTKAFVVAVIEFTICSSNVVFATILIENFDGSAYSFIFGLALKAAALKLFPLICANASVNHL